MAKKKTSMVKTAKKCNCVEMVNEQLRKNNMALPTQLFMNFKTKEGGLALTIPLKRVDSKIRTKLRTLVPTYCPFCGILMREKE